MNSSFEMQLDKVHQNEMEKPEVKEMLKHSTTKNKEVIQHMEKEKELQKIAEKKLEDEKEKENEIPKVSDEEIRKMLEELNEKRNNEQDNEAVPSEVEGDKPSVHNLQTKELKWEDEHIDAENKVIEKELEKLEEKNQKANEQIVNERLDPIQINEDEKENKKETHVNEWELLNNPTTKDGYHIESENKMNIFQNFFFK